MPLEDFHVVAKLGSGVYSSVYKVKRQNDGQFYALKKVKLASLNLREKQNALNQAILLAAIHHPNIIGYREALIDEESASLCIVMEYAQEGDLMGRISKAKQNKEHFEESFIWKVLISVLNGLKRLNQKKIVHRDLKSANIFITDKNVIKIGDLNVSKVVQEGLCFTQTGTPYYASPEIWKDQPYGTKSDVWSLGCVIYELTCLRLPFFGDDMEQLYKSVTKGIYPRIPNLYSTDLNDILRMMLQVDPLVRPSAQRLLTSSIIKKKLKQFHQLQSLISENDLIDQNPEVVTEKHFKKKDIYQLGHHLPEPNYNRGRVKTLHEPREQETKNRSKIYLSKDGYACDYSPPTKNKKSLKEFKCRENSPLLSSKKAAVKILSKRNNVIELARQQIINLETPKIKQIRQRLEKESNSVKNSDQFYMKKLIKNRPNRIKTDTATLLKNIMAMRDREEPKTSKLRNYEKDDSKEH